MPAHLLFVYGGLKRRGWPDDYAVRGEMRMRTSTDPGARFGSEYDTRVFGQLHVVTTSKLQQLIAYEKPQYTLKRVGVFHGKPVLAFECRVQDFEGKPIVESGKFRRR